MRAAILFFAFVCICIAVPSACSSGTPATPPPGGSEAGPGDAGNLGDAQVVPQTEACADAGTACLSGTAATKLFTAKPLQMEVRLYRTYPSGTATPTVTMPVALDGTWAISNLPAWSHYYVQLVADFQGQTYSIASVTGPVTVPSQRPLALTVEPVSLEALEQSGTASGFGLETAAARVFDPSSGAEIQQTATVSISVGGTSTPMPWTMESSTLSSYFVEFATPPAAQSSYTISTAASQLGSSPLMWQLVASPPTFTGMVTAPAMGATVMHGQSLTVTWASQPAADYILVELFEQNSMGQYTATYASPQPDAADTLQEVIAGSYIPTAGTYLLDVFFGTASCPLMADGCVLAGAVSSVNLTVQ
jgi:hypothetical protein